MLLFFKKKTEEAAPEVSAPGRSKIPPHEFIPYYGHYNAHTLLTKNGELMQTIRIARNNRGLNYESGEGDRNSIREIVRKAIADYVTSDKFAVWIHTVRKRTSVEYGGTFKEPLANHVHDRWIKRNRWKYQYYNEVYITVLHDGQITRLMDREALGQTMTPKSNAAYRNHYLAQASRQLDAVVAGMLSTIRQRYQGELLSLKESASGEYYSEPMEFLGTILNLSAHPFLLPEIDISQALCTHTLTFGFNALEAKNAADQKRFGALLTLKQYREMPPESVDRVLQSSTELIISEAFHFIPKKKALKQYEEQKELFDISGDTYSIKASGLEEMLRSNHGRPTDFVDHQTSVMILADEYKLLDNEIKRVQEALYEMGLIMVREDIKLEEGFWAQLPGNFEFLRRKQPISLSKVAGCCRLNLFPGGSSAGNHWGPAVTLMPTTVNSPYFFNFHHQDNGHTVLFDFNSFHDHQGQVLLHFLLTASLKYQGRLYVFDRQRSARLFFNKLDAAYHTFPMKSEPDASQVLRMNPFGLEGNPRNLAFLLAWCSTLVEDTFPIGDAHRQTLQSALEQLYAGAPAERNLPGLVRLLATLDADLAKAFAPFIGNGPYAGWFDAETESLDLTSQLLHAFSMDEVFKHQPGVIPTFSYLMHRIITEIDGKPTIIVLNDAWPLLENAFFAPRLESLLEMLKQNNVMVIFTAPNPQTCSQSHIFPTLMQHCATRLYLPDDITLDYAGSSVGLSEHDDRMLSHMDRQKGHFLLKQGQESIALAANLNVNDMDDIRAIFGGDIKNLIAAGGKFASLPKDY